MRDGLGRRRTAVLTTLAILVLRGAPARGGGGEHDADVALAEALFQDGKRLLEKGDSAAACPKLAESMRLDEATGTLLALAMCHESEGRLASAWAEYAEVVARAQTEGRTDREQAARQSVRALEPRLSTLTVDVPESTAALEGLRVACDGKPLAPAAWSTAVPIDPGAHVVAASAPGHRPWSISLQIGPIADRTTVGVPILAAQEPAPPEEPVPVLAASAADERSGPSRVAPRAREPVTLALLAGVAAGSTSAALAVDLAAVHPSGWGGALRGAYLASNQQEQIDTEGQVKTVRSYALRACAFRRFRAARALALEAGPEVLLQLDREQTTGLGSLPSAWRSAWGLGVQGGADVRLARWVSLSVVASADYAPAAWAGTFEVTNRGAVLRPAAFRVLVGAGPRFALDW